MDLQTRTPPPGDWFRALLEQTDDVVFSFSPGPPAVTHYVSPAVEGLTGLTVDQLVEDPACVLTVLGDASRAWVADVLTGSRSPAPGAIAEIHRPDGTVAWAEVEAVVNRAADGTIERIDGRWRDVTARVLAERRTKLEGQVLASIRDAVVAVDAGGAITFWNEGATDLFERDADTMVGTDLRAMFAEARVGGHEPLLAAIAAGAPWNGDVHLWWPDGRHQHLEVMSYRLEGDGTTGDGAARVHIFWDVAAERAATQQLLRLATSLDQADDAIYTIDPEGFVVTWNRGAELLTGIPASEAVGKRGPLALSQEELDARRPRAFSGGNAGWERNMPFRIGDGTIIPVSMRSVPVRDEAGDVIALSVFAQDDRPRLEAERQHEFNEAILAAIDDAVVVVDLDDRVTFWSPSAERLFRVPAADALGRVLSEVVAVRVIQGSVATARRVVDGGDVFRSDVEYTRLDGSTFTGEITLTGITMADGTPARLGVVRDVTEIRAATAASARLAAIIRTAPDMIVSADTDGRLLTWNEGAHRLLGYTAEEVIGRTIATYVAPESLPLNWEMRRRILEGREDEARGEITVIAKDGTRFPVTLSLGPIRDERGAPVAISAILSDLRVRKALETQAQQGQKLEAVARLARGIAVDYNNMLTAVTGYANLLEAEVDPATPAGDAVRQILRASERAAELTRSLLAFARGGGTREPRTVPVDPVITNLLPMLRRTIPEHVEIRTDLLSGAAASVDVTELELVVLNLAVNGAEAMPNGGALVIETSTVDVSAAQAAARMGLEAGPHVRLTVADTGTGMSDEVRAHIFEPFFTTKAEGHGKGLGLAMAFAYVEAAGGSISVDSAPGRGTVVEILLPLVQVPAAPAAAPAPEHVPERAAGQRVLLVEDDPLVRALALAVLRRGGYQVTALEDPREALALDPTTYDVVLSDIVMPGLTGPVLATRLRAMRPDLPIAFMSGFAEPDVLEEIERLSTQPLLPKPFSPSALLATVRATVEAGAGTEREPAE